MAMLLDINQFNKALNSWMDSEIIPQYDGLKRLGATIVGAMVNRSLAKLYEANKSMLMGVGIVTPEGWIDGDEVICVLNSIFEHQEKLPIGGLIYSVNDLNKLQETMARYAISEAHEENGNGNGNSNIGYNTNRMMNIGGKK